MVVSFDLIIVIQLMCLRHSQKADVPVLGG